MLCNDHESKRDNSDVTVCVVRSIWDEHTHSNRDAHRVNPTRPATRIFFESSTRDPTHDPTRLTRNPTGRVAGRPDDPKNKTFNKVKNFKLKKYVLLFKYTKYNIVYLRQLNNNQIKTII